MRDRFVALLIAVSLLASVASGMPLHFPGEMDATMEFCPMMSRDTTSPQVLSHEKSTVESHSQNQTSSANHCAAMKQSNETETVSAGEDEAAVSEVQDQLSGSANNSPSPQDLARLCCALNCTSPPPISVTANYNFAPATISVEDSVASQISRLFARAPHFATPVVKTYAGFVETYVSPPKYLQNSSFLI